MKKHERAIVSAIIIALSGGLYATGTETVSNMIYGFCFGFYLSVFAQEMKVF